jgi:Bacterial Ig-like domain/Galactose oxidase, central domain
MHAHTRSPAIVSLWFLMTVTAGSERLAPGEAGAAAALLSDGQWLVTGGLAGRGVTTAALLHDARSGLSTPLPAGLGRARAWHSATVLPDGRVAILGGLGATGALVRDAEIFERQTGTFRLLGPTGLRARARHSATLLTDGQVLVVGGVADDRVPIAEGELWDPTTNAVRVITTPLRMPRRDHRAVLLPDGTVLIQGGIDAGGRAADDERYDPRRRSFARTEGDHFDVAAPLPRLEASVPADGDDHVVPDVVIVARFSRPMQADRLGPSTILAGPRGIEPARVVVAEGGRLAFVTPEAPLVSGRYVLSLAGATDIDGVLLPPTAVTFTTAGSQAP